MSRYTKENGDTENKENIRSSSTKTSSSSSSSAGLSGGGGSGLSDYTAQRLAELRARRAEREQEYKELKSSTSASSIISNGDKSSAAKKSDTTTTAAATNGTSSSSTTSPTSSSAASASAALRSSSTAPSSLVDSGGASYHRTRRTEATTNGTSAAVSENGGGSGSGSGRQDYDKESGTKDYVSRLAAEHRTGSNLSRNSSRSTADQEDDEVIGFASLPEQVHRKALKRGFDFTLMVVGETGMGKSTLVQSLFLNNDLYADRQMDRVEDRIQKTVSIEQKFMEIEERGVKLRLTIVDTPGFNDSVNANGSWKLIESYIDRQFEQYLNDESGLSRKNIKDNRVHCCLYFVSPLGHGLRQTDITFMRRMHDKVNIVPVIAKADTLTAAEIKRLKAKILDEIEENNIQIYEFPECDSDEDEDFLQQDKELKAAIPFAVIGSNVVVEMHGKKIRGRQYPWGIVEVDNPDHCDFLKLRQMLISTHMQDLKDVTRDVHYENYRAKHIADQLTKAAQKERNQGIFSYPQYRNLNPDQPPPAYNQYEEIPTAAKRQSKLKRDSSPNFENIVQQDQLLKQKDEEIRKMQEMLMKMQAQLQQSGGSTGQMNGQLNSGLKKL